MNFRSAGFFIINIALSSLLFATPVSDNGALKSKGSKIVGSHGNPVQVAGPSLYWSIWGGENFYNNGAITKIASSWNATLTRASIAVEHDGGYLKSSQKQTGYAKAVVDAAVDNGIYVLVDWHDHNANLHVDAAKEFFSEMVKTYKNTPNVIWEIWNEPDKEHGSGADGLDTWDDIKSYANKVIPVIREHSSNLVVVGTPYWSSSPAMAADSPIEDDNVAYALHFYAGSHGSDVRSNAETAMSKGLALFITEFGTTDYSGGQINKKIYLDKTKEWLDWADIKGISWANWSLSSIPEPCSIIKPGKSTTGNWQESDLTPSGVWIRDRLLARPKMRDDDSVSIMGSANVKEGGSVTITPNSKRFKKGTKVTLKATPASGWEFTSWSNGSTDAEITLTAEKNTLLEAIFSPGTGTNMLKDGDFTTSTAWESWIDTSAGNNATITFTGGQADIRINKTDTLNWGIQISQKGLQIERGSTYTITLDAWSNGERTVGVSLVAFGTWSYLGGADISLTAEKQNFIINITADSTTELGIFQVNAGGSTLPVFVDNIKMFKTHKTGIFNTNSIKRSQSLVTFTKTGNKIYWTSTSPKTKVVLTNMSGRIFQSVSGSKPIHLTNMASGSFLLIATDSIHRQIYQFVK